jgi:hypothetical protein
MFAPRLFMVTHDLKDNVSMKPFGEVGGEARVRSQSAESRHLLGLAIGIGRRKVVLGLEASDRSGTAKPLSEHQDDRGVDIVDARSQLHKFGWH